MEEENTDKKKLKIAIEGLKAIIFEGLDNLKIAEQTLKLVEECDSKNPEEL